VSRWLSTEAVGGWGDCGVEAKDRNVAALLGIKMERWLQWRGYGTIVARVLRIRIGMVAAVISLRISEVAEVVRNKIGEMGYCEVE
jgi:hypothetical protein